MEDSGVNNSAFNDELTEHSNQIVVLRDSGNIISEVQTIPESAPVVSIVVNEEEKPSSKETKQYEGFDRAALLSVMYAVILVSIGLVFPTTEAVKDDWATHHWIAVFMVYLFTGSIAFLLYLQFFVIPRSKKISQICQSTSRVQDEPVAPKPGEIVLKRTRFTQYLTDVPLTTHASSGSFLPSARLSRMSTPTPSVTGVTHQEAVEYINLSSTATVVQAGSSFYLRLGGVAFGVGNIIFVGAQLELHMGNYLAEYCSNKQLVYPMFFHLAFILVQIFFIFKFSRIHVEIHKPIVRFGLMHVLATNLCVWLRVLIEETYHGAHGPGSLKPKQNFQTDYTAQGSPDSNCSTKGSLFDSASPYLFPLVLEYSLTAVAIVYTMASDVVVRISQDVVKVVKETLKRRKKEEARLLEIAQSSPEQQQWHGQSTDGNFNKAHVGLFFGIVMMAAVIISMVIFFHMLNGQNNIMNARLLHKIANVLFHTILLIVVVLAATKLCKLAYSYERNSNVDDFLLIVSMKAIIVFELFILLSEISYISSGGKKTTKALSVAAALITIMQVIGQTLFIMDGLHRYADKEEYKKKMPGKGLITFLIIANVSMWAFKTFQIKYSGMQRQEAFYGKVAWNLIFQINIPLKLFYRFHASVCLANIWHSAYASEDGH